MKQYKCYILVLLLCLGSSCFAQPTNQTITNGNDIIIPFRLTEYNNMVVTAVLNEKDTVQLMFHTAANALTLIRESVLKLKTLQFTGNTDSIKSWGGGANTSRLSINNTLQIAGHVWKQVAAWENENSGQQTDGKFGIDLFAKKTMAINFNTNTITVSDSLPPNMEGYEKLPLFFENDEIFIEATCQTGHATVKNKFLLHSGYAGAILFDDKFAADNKLGEQLSITGERSLKDSFGNTVKTKKAILPALLIGNEKLDNVPAGFFEGAIGRQQVSIMGGDVLKRFNLVIDAQRKYIYLKHSALVSAPYAAF